MAGRISAVIVTYNSDRVLGDLLDSLAVAFAGMAGTEVVVVDNASHDDSVAIARRHPIGARLIETGRNAGYAAAINIAAGEVAEDSALLILNPDIRLRPSAVRALLDAIDRGAGIAVPLMIDEEGRLSLSVRREPSLLSAWSEALVGGRLASRLGLGEVVAPGAIHRRGGTIDWGTGACLLVSPVVRRAIGNWDESYFLYSEETDYMRRTRDAGFSVVYVPAAEVLHIGGEDHVRADLYALLTANRIRYYRHYHGPLAAGLFRLGVMVGESLRMSRGRVHRAGLQAALTLEAR